ncbi:MAG: sensor histidine kinase [Clostridium sp.]|uniref:sensor histidine kinase n=1 Tax=Clostridium sp. TaxID=1506 RepID=UPI003D6D7C8B
MKINVFKHVKKRLRLELILAFIISFILGAISFKRSFELDIIAGSNQFTALRSVIFGVGVFIIIFLLLTRKKMKYIEEISNGLLEISKGNLNYRVAQKGSDELAGLATHINYMASELNEKIEKERRAEKTKIELITNVSHDLRTPLTSIMGYIGLVKDKKYVDEVQMDEYMNIAYNKSENLKILIEDLFEYTKLTNETIALNKEEVALNELLDQLTEELVPIFEENNLTVEREISKEKIMVNLDINKILRVFENLMMNAVKYSLKPSIVKVRLYKDKSNVIVSIENKGAKIPEEDLEKLFERLYRQDKSRAASTGGSGLGLAIAKSIVNLHGGEIWAECKDENIRFFVKLAIA